jgi:hypothetical protein
MQNKSHLTLTVRVLFARCAANSMSKPQQRLEPEQRREVLCTGRSVRRSSPFDPTILARLEISAPSARSDRWCVMTKASCRQVAVECYVLARAVTLQPSCSRPCVGPGFRFPAAPTAGAVIVGACYGLPSEIFPAAAAKPLTPVTIFRCARLPPVVLRPRAGPGLPP